MIKQAVRNNLKLLLSAAFVIAIVLYAVLTPNTPVSLFQEESLLIDEPDAFVTNAIYRTFDVKGNLTSVLHSERAKHFPDTDIGFLTKPDLQLYQEGESNWHATSEEGQFDVKNDHLVLSGNVTILGEDRKGTPFTMTTDKLNYANKSDFIETDLPVKIVSVDSEITAIGMTANLTEKKINLLSKVKGHYVQP